MHKTSAQTVLGGPVRGQLATSVLTPNIIGYGKFDLYATSSGSGDVAAAKAELAACGKPDGVEIGLAVMSDRPGMVSAAVAIQAALKRIGISATIRKRRNDQAVRQYHLSELNDAAINGALGAAVQNTDGSARTAVCVRLPHPRHDRPIAKRC